MGTNEATRRGCHHDRAETSNAPDGRIIADYERGCKSFALAFTAMWAVIAAVEVVSSWA